MSEEELKTIVQGELIDIDKIQEISNEKEIKKIYKIKEEELKVGSLLEAVINRISTKDIITFWSCLSVCLSPQLIKITWKSVKIINFYSNLTDDFTIFTSSQGLSSLSVSTSPILFTTAIPLWILPNMACFPSNHCVGARVMKNCEPLVFGPELAIDKMPAPTSEFLLIIYYEWLLNLEVYLYA